MKSVVIVSTVTFVLIFGGVLLIATQLGRAAGARAVPAFGPADVEAAERVFADLAAERDRLQREKEDLLALRQEVAAQEKILADSRDRLAAVVARLEAEQARYVAERERSAGRLARMYEAMQPEEAAPIMASLEFETVLDILQRMKERPAAKILARMDPALAARISTRLGAGGGDDG